MSKESNTYGEILRSSSIVGAAQAVIYLIGLVRVKLVAVLLGPTGVGLLGLYQSVLAVAGTAVGLGIGSSGVREIAQADASGHLSNLGGVVHSVRCASWASGLLGVAAMLWLGGPLSYVLFESGAEGVRLSLLGAALLFSAVDAGEAALLRGTRRLRELARRDIVAALAGAGVSLILYVAFGIDGIVPALVVSASIGFAASLWFARSLGLPRSVLTWRETWSISRRLIGLGLAFMWSGLLATAAALGIRGVITRELGLDANGIYQAAWGISGMFAGFILSAMGTDFYPRLTAVAQDDSRVNELINQQTEVGLLLAMPGLVGTLAFAPWAMTVFYSQEFVTGSELLTWFVLGTFVRVVSWPMGFVLLAKGAARAFAAIETAFHLGLFFATIYLVRRVGLVGAAVAFALLYGAQLALMYVVARRTSRFRWSRGPIRLFGYSAVLIGAACVTTAVPGAWRHVSGALALVLTTAICFRELLRRLGHEHRLTRALRRLPGARTLLPPG